MQMEGWKAWYADGNIYSSSEISWKELPESGMLGVVVFLNPPYREIVSGGDWYYLDDDSHPSCTDTHEEWGEWVSKPDAPPDEIKQGEGVADEQWSKIQTEMMESK